MSKDNTQMIDFYDDTPLDSVAFASGNSYTNPNGRPESRIDIENCIGWNPSMVDANNDPYCPIFDHAEMNE